MAEHPISFHTDMVMAIREGRKTQTRRLFKPQPDMYAFPCKRIEDHRCPYGQPGDLLWVREAAYPYFLQRPEVRIKYEAGGPDIKTVLPDEVDYRFACDWHRHNLLALNEMPRWASRMSLETTVVRAQQLQDISTEDAIAEGLERYDDDGVVYYGPLNNGHACPKAAFQRLWSSIYGSASWEANPWVWVLEFKVI